jgi:hypothetical protein
LVAAGVAVVVFAAAVALEYKGFRHDGSTRSPYNRKRKEL